MDFLTDNSFKALVQAMKRKPRPLALLGAGSSVDSGYPDWSRLLAMLEEKAQGKVSPKYQSFLHSLNDPAWQAEEYRRLIGEHAFRGLIASVFAPKDKIGPILRAIVNLRFRHILTTNYDSCIEDAYKQAGLQLQIADWLEESIMRSFFLDISGDGVDPYLVYLHGRYYDPANVILTETSYANRYVRSDDASRKLFAILITQSVVFIGFSVNDPDLNHLMREVNARLGSGTPQHFALMGYEVDEQRQLVKKRFEGKYGVQPVFYRVTRESDGRENHSSLVKLLERLYEESQGSLPSKQELKPDSLSSEEKVTADSVQRSGSSATTSVSPPIYDPLDQQKGRWGGNPEAENRRLKVDNIIIREKADFCAFDLIVERANDQAKPLEGEVIFHLHQTFHPPIHVVKVKDGKARLDINAYGAFTVGAEADGGSTRLELDLSRLQDFPQWFRER